MSTLIQTIHPYRKLFQVRTLTMFVHAFIIISSYESKNTITMSVLRGHAWGCGNEKPCAEVP